MTPSGAKRAYKDASARLYLPIKMCILSRLSADFIPVLAQTWRRIASNESTEMNILLVEDDREVGARLRRRMEGAGHTLDWTAEPLQAFACASSSRYDAVIIDLGVAGRSGIELCAKLRERSQALPILMLSASDWVADRLESFSAGADDVLGTPFDPEELMARLAAIQRRTAPARSASAAHPTRMIVFERTSGVAQLASCAVGLTDREHRFFDVLLRHKSGGASLAASFRKACDVDVATQTDARGMMPGLRLCLAGARDAGRRFVLAGTRLARRRA